MYVSRARSVAAFVLLSAWVLLLAACQTDSGIPGVEQLDIAAGDVQGNGDGLALEDGLPIDDGAAKDGHLPGEDAVTPNPDGSTPDSADLDANPPGDDVVSTADATDTGAATEHDAAVEACKEGSQDDPCSFDFDGETFEGHCTAKNGEVICDAEPVVEPQDCPTCVATECSDEFGACEQDPACVDLAGCVNGCQDQGCVGDCAEQYPDGVPEIQGMLQCQQSACGEACGGGPQPTGCTNDGDCSGGRVCCDSGDGQGPACHFANQCGGGNPPPPIEACLGKNPGDACQLEAMGGQTLDGTCTPQQGELWCETQGGGGIDAAVEACVGKAPGDACAATVYGQDYEGTCQDNFGEFACTPGEGGSGDDPVAVCEGKNDGEPCSATSFGYTFDGTCKDVWGTFACSPW